MYFPWIRLAGVWLEEAGFEAGGRVRITFQDSNSSLLRCDRHIAYGGRRESLSTWKLGTRGSIPLVTVTSDDCSETAAGPSLRSSAA
ncbi:SymE family type I addiction module toxin [Burkholderia diffusa]|uniref:SymE family type I addiction module toxin n=1 Tax=Burkholderia diffusa TaxID=488732 RepID=UPI001E3DDB52|nr:SymE family type I addiction module toxin [Burkholderia diffusa]